MPAFDEQRLADLETKLAFQDRLIEQLNEALMEAHGAVQQCQQRIDQLESRLDQLGGSGQDIVDARPPHY